MVSDGVQMLSEFVTANRVEILARCCALVASRMAPRPTAHELETGIPMFLDQLLANLDTTSPDSAGATNPSATSAYIETHGVGTCGNVSR